MTEYGIAQVSTLDPDPRLQLDALLAAGVPGENICVDHASGTRQDRPGLAFALSSATAGDRLRVWPAGPPRPLAAALGHHGRGPRPTRGAVPVCLGPGRQGSAQRTEIS